MGSKVQEFNFEQKGVDVDSVFQDLEKENYFDEIWEQYKDPATLYAYLVLSGKQLAGEKIKLAMFRHINDLKRSKYNDDFNYQYSLRECHNILNFAKVCPDVEANKPMPLMAWQQAMLCLIQGWRIPDGEKRFTFGYISVARTNGKTYVMNILLSYSYLIEAGDRTNLDLGYIGPVEVISKKGMRYLGSTIEYLSRIPGFKKLIRQRSITSSTDLIKSSQTKNQILRLTAGSGKFDRFHFQTAIIDEYGDANYTDEMIGKITSGQVHQYNKQTIAISTAYENSNVPMYHDYQRLTKTIMRDDLRENETSLFMVWEQDSIDETDKPETWIKSNPLLGLPEMHDRLLAGLNDEKTKRESAGMITWFQNRNLNLWLAVAKDKYLQLDDIQTAVIPESDFNIDDRDVYVGLDMSRLDDDSAISFVFPYLKNRREMMHLYQHSFVPTAQSQKNILLKSKKDGINYSQAAEHGFADIARNADGLIDDEVVGDWFMNFIDDHNLHVKAFVYDYHLASPLVEWLDRNLPEIPFITLRQGTLSLDEPTRRLQKMFIRHSVTMFDDQIIKYSLTNAVLTSNNYGIKVDKAVHSAKIDCVDAIINAVNEAKYWYTDPDRNKDEPDKKHPFAGMNTQSISDYFKNDFSF